MCLTLASPLDSGQAALLGALIGAGASVIVQIIAAFVTARHETRSFRRTLLKDQISSITDAYEYAINVISNMRTGGTADRTTQGNVLAQTSLRGSTEVKAIVESFFALPTANRQEFELAPLVNAMQQHLAQLEKSAK